MSSGKKEKVLEECVIIAESYIFGIGLNKIGSLPLKGRLKFSFKISESFF
jgi:hypothetical protein